MRGGGAVLVKAGGESSGKGDRKVGRAFKSRTIMAGKAQESSDISRGVTF